MTLKKKALAVLMALVLIMSCTAVAFAETPEEVDYNGKPIVVVGGYGGAQLKLRENDEVVWYINTDDVVHDLFKT